MNWVCGTVATSTLDPQADFRRPDAVSYTFLDQPQQAARFRAFTGDGLESTAFTGVAEQHLRRVAEDAGWSSESRHDAPVFIGSSSCAIAECENRRHTGDADTGEYGLLYLAEDSRKRSDNQQIFSLATACILSAHTLIQTDGCLRGGVERAFVLGIENLNRLALLHFHSLGLFTERYRPFGGGGLISGEGVAVLALSAAPSDYIGCLELVGHAANTDNDLIQSNSKASGQVIRRVLNAAAVLPENIAAVKTHGTGTVDGGAAKLVAPEDVFGTLPPPVAFRAQVGHILSTTTALETALPLSVLKQGGGTDYQGREIRFSDDVFCLANHLGFGGSNAAMVWQWQSQTPTSTSLPPCVSISESPSATKSSNRPCSSRMVRTPAVSAT